MASTLPMRRIEFPELARRPGGMLLPDSIDPHPPEYSAESANRPQFALADEWAGQAAEAGPQAGPDNWCERAARTRTLIVQWNHTDRPPSGRQFERGSSCRATQQDSKIDAENL
jgi:hypothetical protein